MAVERPAGSSPGRGGGGRNSILMSALRLAGYHDLDYRSSSGGSTAAATTTTTTTTTMTGTNNKTTPAASASASAANTDAVLSAGGRYMHTLPADVESARPLLEQYSGIPAADVDRHVFQMRDRLWDLYPYACIGRFRFASLEFAADAYYQVALFRLLQAAQTPSDSTRLLDVGCCVGQVLRKLAFDGVDSARLFGTDLDPRLLDLGFDLFRDRGKFRGRFVAGDILRGRGRREGESAGTGEGKVDGKADDDGGDDSDTNDPLTTFNNEMTFIHATSFFHLFTWDDQVAAAIRMVRFLRPDRPDAMVFGRQVGTTRPRDSASKAGRDSVYLHNAESWQRLWDEVGRRTASRWRAAMEPTERIETGVGESSLRKMTFCVTRA
ncbi:hypothetical protein F4859DRAFT_343787 [Xylaria cf. heliscus]|nr:hypothetical protein F4859DRAFT_343787 [Xylaria cf. heliscus]